MALIMYLTRVPRCEDITAEQIVLIENYLEWQDENDKNSKYSCDTFEKWCGIPDYKVPNKEYINFYKPYFTKKSMYAEGIGTQECYSIFEQLARLVKTNQIFNWFIKNIMNNYPTKRYYKIAKEHLEELLECCLKVKNRFTLTSDNTYNVDENVAKELLPLLENPGYFFGTNEYDEAYAEQIIKTIDIINNILETTDFEKQTIYFNAIW